MIEQLRRDHPTLSCRAMYYKLRPEAIGRDAFEELCKGLGFTVESKRNPRRTTYSIGVIRFDNLLSDLVLLTINQAWSSDITYYEVGDVCYYITFIMDCYSRRILGCQVSKRLITEHTTLACIKKAVHARGKIAEGMIFHSDGGGQYYDAAFLKYTNQWKMRNSMCEYAYENGKAERLNGIIKNNYLRHYQIKNYEQLEKYVDRAVYLYNYERPHKALNYKTPVEFEKSIALLQKQTRPKMTESLEATRSI